MKLFEAGVSDPGRKGRSRNGVSIAAAESELAMDAGSVPGCSSGEKILARIPLDFISWVHSWMSSCTSSGATVLHNHASSHCGTGGATGPPTSTGAASLLAFDVAPALSLLLKTFEKNGILLLCPLLQDSRVGYAPARRAWDLKARERSCGFEASNA